MRSLTEIIEELPLNQQEQIRKAAERLIKANASANAEEARLEGIPTIGSHIWEPVAKRLDDAGYKTLLHIHQTSDEKLRCIGEIGRLKITGIRESIQKTLYERPAGGENERG